MTATASPCLASRTVAAPVGAADVPAPHHDTPAASQPLTGPTRLVAARHPAGGGGEGAPTPTESVAWLPAGPCRAHFQALVESTALPWEVVALAVGIPLRTGRRLVGPGRRLQETIREADARRLHEVSPAVLRARTIERVSATPTATRVRRLLADGWTLDELAAATGLQPGLLARLRERQMADVSAQTAWRIEAAWQQHLGSPARRPRRPDHDGRPGGRVGSLATMACPPDHPAAA